MATAVVVQADPSGVDWTIEALTNEGFGVDKGKEPDTVLITNLFGSDPEDVVFELEWHGLHAQIVEVGAGESE